MKEPDSEAHNWEQGCSKDQLRNDFIIPQVARLFEARRPATILDVGAATGYVAREINKRLSYQPHWTLLDLCAERLALAEQLSSDMSQATLACDIIGLAQRGEHYDAALLTFTLLEVAEVERCLSELSELIDTGGAMVVALPDVLRDVCVEATSNFSILESFLDGPVELPKTDKFTSRPYPFRAVRNETIIEMALESGFFLRSLKSQKHPGQECFIMEFEK